MISKPTIINTLRHARTSYNEEKRYAGTIDIPLSKEGVREAEALSAQLAKTHYDAVVTSVLKRAYQTARILVGNRKRIMQTSLCNERNFGIMEGLTWDEVQNLNPPVLMIEVGGDLHTVNPKGGEPFEAVWERAKKFHRFLFKNYSGKKILVVSHGVFLQMFHGLLKGENCIEALCTYPSNLEMVTFRFTGQTLSQVKVCKLDSVEQLQW